MVLDKQAIVHKVRKLCIRWFALDVSLYAISHVMTYLALTNVPGATEVGFSRVFMDAYGTELGLLAMFGCILAVLTLSAIGSYFCTLPNTLYKGFIFYISVIVLAFDTPVAFLHALNDTMAFLFRITPLAENLDLFNLVVIILGGVSAMIFLVYIWRLLPKKATTNRGKSSNETCHARTKASLTTAKKIPTYLV